MVTCKYDLNGNCRPSVSLGLKLPTAQDQKQVFFVEGLRVFYLYIIRILPTFLPLLKYLENLYENLWRCYNFVKTIF